MEKGHLLQELANLKCILGNYELTSENPDMKFPDKVKTRRNVSNAGNLNKNSMIFVNPDKINTINSNKSSILADKVTWKSYSSTNDCGNESKIENGVKVYINPNFKKSDVQCHNKKDYTNVNKKQKTCFAPNLGLDNNSDKTYGVKRALVQIQNEENPSKISDKSCNAPLSTIKHKIFINPKFTAGDKMTDGSLHETSQQSLDKKLNTNANEYINSFNNKSEECMKINEFYNNRTYMLEKTKSTLNMASTSKTIFLNPKFENSQNVLNKDICDVKEMDAKVVQEKKQNYGSNSIQDFKSTVKRTSESLKFPNLQRKATINLLDNSISKTNSSKLPNQCVKLHSSPFVALSATKLIRKRKSSLNLSEKVVNNPLLKPEFVSKTKLIRICFSKSNITNCKLMKDRIKHISKTQPEALSTEQKLHKNNIINSNLVQVAPTSTSIMKIQSKNGKSLRLIRRSMRCNLPSVEMNKMKSFNILQKHKRLLRLQAKKKKVWNDQNKLRKSQYSKINVLNSGNGENSYTNKYVYRNKALCSRKTNISQNVLNKKSRKLNKLNNFHDLSLMFSKNTPSKYRLVRKQPCSPNNKIIKSSKHTLPLKTNSVRPNQKLKWKGQSHMKRKSLSIVNIGGVFYKCSRTCLSKNKPTPKKVSQKQSKGPLLHIRGQRFQLDNSGQTLTCLDRTPGRQRIDIGGVTFIASSSGSSLIRTNYHTARSILVQAKQKSISLLTRKLKKNNEPCPFFHRFGRCTGKERGTCIRLHDSKFVAVCKKFVAGQCTDNGCLLSHQISCYNMPTCQHYLAGHCGRDACPYPHVKLSDSAPICLQFLQGFCFLGDECRKRHLEICPSFEKGLCSRGKFCPYPHPKSKSSNQLKGKLKYLKKEPQLKRNAEVVSNSNLRYFEDVHLQKENQIQLNEDQIKLEDCSSEGEEPSHIMKNRPRLGRLPSFIPLNSKDSVNSVLQEIEK